MKYCGDVFLQESDVPGSKRVFVNNNLKELFDNRLHLAKKQHLKENIPQKNGSGLDVRNGTKGKVLFLKSCCSLQ